MNSNIANRLHAPARALLLLFTLSLCLISSGSRAQLAKRNDRASERLGIKLSLQCYTFRALTFFETVDEAAKMGIRYLEIFPGQKIQAGSDDTMNWHMSPANITAIKAKLKSAGGLKLIGYGVDGVPTEEVEARKMFDWAKLMGVTVLVTETTPTELHDKLCTEYNIRMALHNHPSSWPPDEVLKATKDRVKLIGSCSDTGHWMRRNLVPTEQLKKLQGRVEHLHFKDLNQYGSGEDLPWGTGQGDAKGMLTELKRQGYHGFVSIEYEVGSVADLESNLPKCVSFFDTTLTDLSKSR